MPGTLRADIQRLTTQAVAARAAGDRLASLALSRQATLLAPQNVGLRMHAASDLLALGRAGEMEAEYLAALASSPAHPAVMIGLGLVARRGGDRAAALAWFEKAVAADRMNRGAWLELAGEHRQTGGLAAARAAYRTVLRTWPNDANALLGLAVCARQEGGHEESLAWHRQLLAADPGHVWARLQAGADLCALGRLDEAEATYRAVLAVDAASVAALLGLGQCARRRQDRVAALAWNRAAADAAPDNAWCRLECATDLRALGRLDEARVLLLALDGEGAHGAQVKLSLGQLERAAGRRGLALAYLGAAVAADPASAVAGLELAAEHRAAGAWDAARGAAHAVLARAAAGAGQADALASLGQTERAAGRHEAALEAFTRACAALPGRAETLAHMAAEARALGRSADSAAWLAQAQAADPDDPAVLLQCAEAARLADDGDAMLAAARRGAARLPDHLGLAMGEVEATLLAGEPDAALRLLDAAGLRFGPAPALLARRCALLRRIGRWPAALAAARALTALHPDDFGAWMERLAVETGLGTDAQVDACLRGARPQTQAERIRLARLCAEVQEGRAAWPQAAAAYDAAVALDPADAETRFGHARCQLGGLQVGAAAASLAAYLRLTEASRRARGVFGRAAQTHFGQLLEEFGLDPALGAAQAALGRLAEGGEAAAGSAAVAEVLEIVRAHPHSTAAAMALQRALAAAGCVTRPGAVAAGQDAVAGGVPRHVAQFWDKPAVPGGVAGLMGGWAAANPGWTTHLLDGGAARAFLARQCGPDLAALFDRAADGVRRTDLLRLAWLAAAGGVWADSDAGCHAPLDGTLPPAAGLVVYQDEFGCLGNAVVAAQAGHPVMTRALRLAAGALARGDGEAAWLSTGPGLLNRAFAQHLAAAPDWRAAMAGMAVLSRRALSAGVALRCHVAYKTTTIDQSNPARVAG